MSKVSSGDPLKISARDWNTLIEVAESSRLGQFRQTASGLSVPSSPGVVVPVKNGTGSTVDRYHAMGINTPLFAYTDNAQTFKNQLGFDGATTSSSYLGKWCIAQETIANGKIGMAMLRGVTVAQITVNHADHDRVDVDTGGDSKLDSQFYGSGQILWKETGTGTKWAVIAIGDFVSPQLKATASGAIAVNSSGTVQIQRNGSGSESVTAYLNWMEGTTAVASADELTIYFFKDEDRYVILGAEC